MPKRDKLQKLTKLDIDFRKDHWSGYNKNQLSDVGQSLSGVLSELECHRPLMQLGQSRFFSIFIPELETLKKIPQNKQNSSDAFHHSVLVAHNVKSSHVLKWAALLHDIGKGAGKVDLNGNVDFRGHEFTGAKMAKGILKRMKIPNSGDIYKLVQFHSHPLDYQRQPNWRMETVVKFVDKYGHLAPMLIDLAIADKISSSNKADYLEELYKLKQMVEEIQYEPKGAV